MPQQATFAPAPRQTEYAALPDPYRGDPWSWAFVIFRHIPGFPGYVADTEGDIWSCRSRGRYGTAIGPWRRLSKLTHLNGYQSVCLRASGCSYRRMVHRLVLESFVGPCPEGMESRHFPDPDPTNNRARNLNWGTPKANGQDRIVHGTSQKGSLNSQSKLTESDVIRIREMKSRGMCFREIAEVFGVSKTVARRAAVRETWKHIN